MDIAAVGPAFDPSQAVVTRRKVDDIIAIARQEFARVGYRGVTIRGVAEKTQVSTRTLYNHFTDKLGLFTACIEAGAENFPKPDFRSNSKPAETLRTFVAALLTYLSSERSLQISLIIFRDGGEFPEIRKAAKKNHERHVVVPLSDYLMAHGSEPSTAFWLARLFSNMATSEWQRRILFGEPMLIAPEIDEHADHVTGVFLLGAQARALINGAPIRPEHSPGCQRSRNS